MDMPHTYKAHHNLNFQGIIILFLIVDFIVFCWGYNKMSIFFLGIFKLKFLNYKIKIPPLWGLIIFSFPSKLKSF